VGAAGARASAHYCRARRRTEGEARWASQASRSKRSPSARLERRLEFEVERCLELGTPDVLIPWLKPERRSGYRGLAEIINGLGARCKAMGTQLHYHNHEFEYEREDGQRVIDFHAIFRAAESQGVEWYVAEQDWTARPPLESAELSLRHLREWGKL
jgi:hypothetical protein